MGEVVVCIADEAEGQGDLEAREGGFVEDGEVLASLCVAGEEDEGEGQGGVEDGLLDEGAEYFRGETWGGGDVSLPPLF